MEMLYYALNWCLSYTLFHPKVHTHEPQAGCFPARQHKKILRGDILSWNETRNGHEATVERITPPPPIYFKLRLPEAKLPFHQREVFLIS